MIILGLTGSIGMGKTTTAGLFADEGCPVFNADKAVHQLYSKGGKAVPLIKAVFPDAVKDDAVDRAVLGDHMRADPLNLKVLESFIHPWVEELRQLFFAESRRKEADIVVLDIPLLFETGGDKKVDITVTVSAPYKVQKARVMARPGMTEELFEMLLGRQMSDKEKRSRSDYVLSTGESISETRKQVQELVQKLRAKEA
ncbi:dephospho-CoA kinase [Litorimonas haliclonae]|uniref:dephospho-CoA kinase n=1 Tax=Litorimonas haliclonae TaxID=2081977 RepID=UPI0039F0376F